jgi:uncharacterized protein (DUF362 family)
LYKKKLTYGLNLLGGIESLIPTNKKVLLKPNLLMGTSVEDAVTTHPIILESIIAILKKRGYTVGYGDSPGFGQPDKVANKAGLKEVANKHGIPIADFTNGYTAHHTKGKICKQFQIVDAYKEHDAIINLPKMKSHALQRIKVPLRTRLDLFMDTIKG